MMCARPRLKGSRDAGRLPGTDPPRIRRHGETVLRVADDTDALDMLSPEWTSPVIGFTIGLAGVPVQHRVLCTS